MQFHKPMVANHAAKTVLFNKLRSGPPPAAAFSSTSARPLALTPRSTLFLVGAFAPAPAAAAAAWC